jgi:hypothetical protein
MERPDQVAHHQLVLDENHGAGFAVIDAPTRQLLHDLRWRRSPRESWVTILGLVAAIIFHVLLFIFARLAMQAHEEVWAPPFTVDARPLEVRLLDREPRPVAASVPPPPALPAERSKVATTSPATPRLVREISQNPLIPPKPTTHATPAPKADVAATAAPVAAAAPTPTHADIYDKVGTVKLPPAPPSTAPAPNYVQQMPKGDDKVMSHKSPLSYKETRFDKDWVPVRENIVQAGVRNVVQAITVNQTIDVGNGARVDCSFMIVFASCGGNPPPPPAKKDGDKRLSMPPANPLVKDLNPPPAVDLQECFRIYRAGDPLPYGCPTDTPQQAVDEERKRRHMH